MYELLNFDHRYMGYHVFTLLEDILEIRYVLFQQRKKIV